MKSTRAAIILAVFFLGLGIFYLPNFFYGDSCGNFAIVRSLSNDGDLDLRNQQDTCEGSWSGMVSQGRNGEWYSVHEMLFPVIVTPLFKLIGTFGIELGTIFITIGALFALLQFSTRFSTHLSATIAAFVLVICEPIRSVPFAFSNDLFAGCCLVWVLSLLSGRRYFIGGMVWTVAFIGRMHVVVSIFSFLLYILYQKEDGLRGTTRPVKNLFLFVLGIAASMPLYLAQNYLLFGNMLYSTYSQQLHLVQNVYTVSPALHFFELPSISRISFLLFNYRDGIALSQPFFIFVWWFGGVMIWRVDKAFMLCSIGGLLSYLLFYSCYSDLHSPGRYFLFFHFLTMIPLAVALQRYILDFICKAPPNSQL